MRYAMLIYSDQEPWFELSEEESAKASEESLPKWYAFFEELGLPRQRPVAANPVDRAVLGRRDDPGAGIGRCSVTRPALQRRCEGVLDGVLGEVEVAEHADEDRDRTSPLLAEDAIDVRYWDPTQQCTLAPGPRSRGARARPRPCQG